MKSRTGFVVLALAAGQAVAGPAGLNDKIVNRAEYEDAISHNKIFKRQSTTWTRNALCEGDKTVATMLDPKFNFDAPDFCYWYLQPQTYSFILSSSAVESTTLTSVSSTATTTVTTTTNSASATVTALCATPSKGSQCGIIANGNSINVLTADWNNNTGFSCQQACLANPLCKMFQLVPEDNGQMKWTMCQHFNDTVAAAAFPDSVIGNAKPLVYDRACQDFMPDGCKAPPTPASKPRRAPAALITPAAQLKRQELGDPHPRITAWPSQLSLGVEALWWGCSCVITEAAPTLSKTVTLVVPIYSETTVQVTRTQIDVVTQVPNYITAYRTVL